MLMIGAALVAIAIIGGLMLEWQAATRRAQIREQGVGLVRLLSRMPYEQLAPKSGNASLLQAALQGSRSSDVGYGAIVDLRGTTLSEVTAAGVLVPPAPPASQGDAQFGERALSSPGDARRITEYYGPMLDEGKVVGQVRVGFYEAGPRFLPGIEQMPFLALLALPVFLLVPLFHFVLKRELRPLAEIGKELRRVADNGPAPAAELVMSGDLREFASGFGRFMEGMQTRMREVESERFSSVVSQRLLGYRQEKTESVLHALPDAILVLDEEGVVTYANAKLDPVLRVPHDTIMGRNVREIETAPALVEFLRRCQSEKGRVFRGETIEFSPPEQPDRRIAASAYPLFSPREPGAVLGILTVFRDVTQELHARNAGAEFVAHVSHELKSPLNVMRMYSETLLDGSLDSEASRIEAINVIKDEAERMASLINNLLNIARIESGSVALDRQRTRLRDLLEDVFAETTRNATGKDIRLELDLPAELSPVMIDKDLVRIAIANLIGNAIKYNRPGGRVALCAEESDAEVLVRVLDSGIGILPADQAKVFDKFFRSADTTAIERGGHGLGLYLVKQITELHHGSVGLTSSPGSGSEFCMRFRKISAMAQESARV
jgi:signal transduction histidine kinase